MSLVAFASIAAFAEITWNTLSDAVAASCILVFGRFGELLPAENARSEHEDDGDSCRCNQSADSHPCIEFHLSSHCTAAPSGRATLSQ